MQRVVKGGQAIAANVFNGFLLWMILAALAGWASAEDQDRQESRQLTLFYSASVAGAFEPCGCSGKPAGGLARRAGEFNKYAEGYSHPILQVDAGNYFAPLGPGSSLVNGLMAESLSEFPLAVLNLASEDLHYWDEISAREDLSTQVISTNLKPRRSARASPRPYAVVEIGGEKLGLARNLRIGFLGITDPRLVKPNSGFRATDPIQAIAEVKQEILEQADWLVVLADFKRQAKEIGPDSFFYRLAQAHPEVEVIVHTEKRYVLFPPEKAGEATLVGGVERGRQLARLVLKLDEEGRVAGLEQAFQELEEGAAEDESWLQRQAQVKVFIQ